MTSYLSTLVVVVSVQVMVIDVAVCMVALTLLGGLGTASILIIIKYVLSIIIMVNAIPHS